ncbi:MAG: hypothetical protein Kow0075_16500 [Salibacteraceae bacterium]
MNHTAKILFSVLLLIAAGCGNRCDKVLCHNGGECFEGDCICSKWYSGEACDLMYNRNYTGTYLSERTSLSGNIVKDTITISAHSYIPNRLMIDEYELYFDFETDSTIVIPKQEWHMDSEATVSITGYGEYSDMVFMLYFSELDVRSEGTSHSADVYAISATKLE